MKTRREALLSIAAAASIPALRAQHHHMEAASEAPAPQVRKFFSPDEFDTLNALVETIIPRTDTPGAADAGVGFLIDEHATNSPETGETLRHGLGWLRDSGFLKMSGEDRIKLLSDAVAQPETSNGEFVDLAKSLTIGAYYSTKEGLITELGWHGNTYLTSFPGCTHPEHQRD